MINQAGIGVIMYAGENEDKLFTPRLVGSSPIRYNLHALNDDSATRSKSVGLDPTQSSSQDLTKFRQSLKLIPLPAAKANP